MYKDNPQVSKRHVGPVCCILLFSFQGSFQPQKGPRGRCRDVFFYCLSLPVFLLRRDEQSILFSTRCQYSFSSCCHLCSTGTLRLSAAVPVSLKTAANYTIPQGLSMRNRTGGEKVTRKFPPFLKITIHPPSQKENRLHFVNENRNMANRLIRLHFQTRKARKILLPN